MSVQALTWAWAQCPCDENGAPLLQSTDKLALLALANFADENGLCWPSQARLAEMAMCSVRTVRRSLERLQTLGLIIKKKRGAPGGGRTTDHYHLALENDAKPKEKKRPLAAKMSGKVSGHSCVPFKPDIAVSYELSKRTVNNKPAPSEQDAAREGKQLEVGQLIKIGLKRGKADIFPHARKWAEALGCPVDEFEAKARRPGVERPGAYFEKLCRDHLTDMFRGQPTKPSPEVIRGAISSAHGFRTMQGIINAMFAQPSAAVQVARL